MPARGAALRDDRSGLGGPRPLRPTGPACASCGPTLGANPSPPSNASDAPATGQQRPAARRNPDWPGGQTVHYVSIEIAFPGACVQNLLPGPWGLRTNKRPKKGGQMIWQGPAVSSGCLPAASMSSGLRPEEVLSTLLLLQNPLLRVLWVEMGGDRTWQLSPPLGGEETTS